MGDVVSKPDITPADLEVEITSLDIPKRAVSARMSLTISDDIASSLRLNDLLTTPLPKAPRASWTLIPVGIMLTPCLSDTMPRANCGIPAATLPLGKLVGADGKPTPRGSVVASTVTLPVSGLPSLFPSDSYTLAINDPRATLPGSVALFSEQGPGLEVPLTVNIYTAPALGEHSLVVVESAQKNPRVIGVIIDRPFYEQITIYLVALLPLLLGAVVAHVLFIRRQRDFDLELTAGLIAVVLTILPLRSVLVPADVASIGLTFLDDILVISVLGIAALVFGQYARTVARMPTGSNHQLGA
ncbi:hypothetical protein [Streptomyces pristinaespiralis]|uniref:hypothetical protein n=1 Tax=Streptomyces pristinaespiralis TaxID=38300 RepID=UPI0033D17CF0